jgi:peptide/nickel transport system substrate-binding protein
MKSLVLFFLFLLLVTSPSTLAQDSGDSIHLMTLLDLGNFNPVFQTNSAISRLSWEALYRVDGETGLPTSGLGLTSWEISEDGLTYTFTIRDDAFWSDGEPITTTDIQYTLDTISSDQVTSWLSAYITAELFSNFEIVNDKVFTVTLESPNCTFINSLFWLVPIPAHIFGPEPSGVNDHPNNTHGGVSSGPYTVIEYSANEFVRFEANPYYYGGEPKIKSIIMRFEGDAAVTNLMLASGEIDFLRMTAAQFDQLPDPNQFNYYNVPNQFATGMLLNSADPNHPMPAYDEAGTPNQQPPHPVLGDVRVRQAISLGYDKRNILRSIREEGAGELMTWMFHPQLEAWANNPELQPAKYDPDTASALLEEAGWTDSDGDGIRECHDCQYAEEGTPLAFTITYAPIYAEYANVALIAQDQLHGIGFDVTVDRIEYGTLITEYLLPQAFDAIVLSFGGFPTDPDGLVTPFLRSENDQPGVGYNWTSVVNHEIDRLLEAGRSVASCAIEERAPYYHQIQEIGLENSYMADWAFITYDYLVVSKRIDGFVLTPRGGEGSEYNSIQDWTFSQ